MNKLITIDWSVYLGYHVVKKILPFGFQFRAEKWRAYGESRFRPWRDDFLLASHCLETKMILDLKSLPPLIRMKMFHKYLHNFNCHIYLAWSKQSEV